MLRFGGLLRQRGTMAVPARFYVGGFTRASSEVETEPVGSRLFPYHMEMTRMFRQRQVQQGYELFEDMVANRVLPNKGTYHLLILAAVRADHMSQAFKYLELMRKRGLVPDQGVYGALIGLCGKRMHHKNAKWLIDELKRDGIIPDAAVWSSITCALISCGDINAAMDCLREAREGGVRPRENVYAGLLKHFSYESDLERINVVFEEMQREKQLLTSRGYNTMIAACCRLGALDRAEEVFAQLEGDSGSVPNEGAYHVLITALTRAKEPDRAMIFYRKALSRGVKLSPETYINLIKGNGKPDRIHVAVDVVEDIQHEMQVPFAVLNELLRRCCDESLDPHTRYRLIPKAHILYDVLRRDDRRPTEDIFRPYAALCAKDSSPKAAANLKHVNGLITELNLAFGDGDEEINSFGLSAGSVGDAEGSAWAESELSDFDSALHFSDSADKDSSSAEDVPSLADQDVGLSADQDVGLSADQDMDSSAHSYEDTSEYTDGKR